MVIALAPAPPRASDAHRCQAVLGYVPTLVAGGRRASPQWTRCGAPLDAAPGMAWHARSSARTSGFGVSSRRKGSRSSSLYFFGGGHRVRDASSSVVDGDHPASDWPGVAERRFVRAMRVDSTVGRVPTLLIRHGPPREAAHAARWCR